MLHIGSSGRGNYSGRGSRPHDLHQPRDFDHPCRGYCGNRGNRGRGTRGGGVNSRRNDDPCMQPPIKGFEFSMLYFFFCEKNKLDFIGFIYH